MVSLVSVVSFRCFGLPRGNRIEILSSFRLRRFWTKKDEKEESLKPGWLLGPIAGYVPLASQSPCPIIVIFYGQL